jgi:peptidyl-tRNA hydrolase, PTH1 family
MIEDNHNPFIIVGLGNPGLKYRSNRHNVGFMLLDKLADHFGVQFSRMEMKALVAKASINNQRLILAKPHTYMNLSGQAVGSLVRYYQTPLTRLLVAYDDVDLPFGTLRLRPGGGSAGQKGMASIIERLGQQDFPRIRIGIGRPPGRMEAADYVLQDFTADEKQFIQITLKNAIEAVLLFITEDLNSAMNRFNTQIQENDP